MAIVRPSAPTTRIGRSELVTPETAAIEFARHEVKPRPNPVKKSPQERLAAIAKSVNQSAEELLAASEAYELSKTQPPDTTEDDLREHIASLEASLNDARAKLEAHITKGTPLDQYREAAELAERSVDALSGSMLIALTDRDLLETFKVDRDRLPEPVIRATEAKHADLRGFLKFSSLWRDQLSLVNSETYMAEQEHRQVKRVSVAVS